MLNLTGRGGVVSPQAAFDFLVALGVAKEGEKNIMSFQLEIDRWGIGLTVTRQTPEGAKERLHCQYLPSDAPMPMSEVEAWLTRDKEGFCAHVNSLRERRTRIQEQFLNLLGLSEAKGVETVRLVCDSESVAKLTVTYAPYIEPNVCLSSDFPQPVRTKLI